jgi:UDP-N-acetyl-D-mannosaminuronic acid dehydrogenase
LLFDTNLDALNHIRAGNMPFLEHDAQPILNNVLNKKLFLTSSISDVANADFVIVAIGTPVDEYLNPKLRALFDLFDQLLPHIDPSQTIIIRSTVFPRTCKQIKSRLEKYGIGPWKVAYCPERIAQGYAIRELKELPQLVAGVDVESEQNAADLFATISLKIIKVTIEEAELAKLFSNAWRYIQFAAANQFYMISHQFGVDYNRVRTAMVEGYGRSIGLPSAGFTAGPCLLKDTMQLAAFNNQNFLLGQAAMNINEGMPNFIVENLRKRYDLESLKVGILGMAFKADIDDTRDSLSYKLGKILRFHGALVCYSDEYVQDPSFISKEALVASSDVIIVGAAHSAYKTLNVPSNKYVIDLWEIIYR